MDELQALAAGPLAWFRVWPNPAVPIVAAGVYTVWSKDELVYARMAGRSLTSKIMLAARCAVRPSG